MNDETTTIERIPPPGSPRRKAGDVGAFLETMARRNLHPEVFASMVDKVPEGKSGGVVVKHVTLSSTSVMMENMRAARDGDMEALCCPGRFAILGINGETMMSDTPMERATNLEAVRAARGRVLIAGLGLGMVAHPIARKPEVSEVVIVEKNPDVIRLVAPTLPSNIRVVPGDIADFLAKEGKPAPACRQRFDAVWLDLWKSVDTDDLPEIARLRKAARRIMAPGAWLGVWQDAKRKRESRLLRRGW